MTKAAHKDLVSQALTSAKAWRDSENLDLETGIKSLQVNFGAGLTCPIKNLLTDGGQAYDNMRRFLANQREDVAVGIDIFQVDEEKRAFILKKTMKNL